MPSREVESPCRRRQGIHSHHGDPDAEGRRNEKRRDEKVISGHCISQGRRATPSWTGPKNRAESASSSPRKVRVPHLRQSPRPHPHEESRPNHLTFETYNQQARVS